MNMQSALKRFITAIIITILAGTPILRAETVTVFAAASLTESLRQIATAYEKRTGDTIVFNFAASGPLVRQIEEGAPADIFFSADEAKMNDAGSKDLLVKSSRRSLLSNLLVVVAASASTLALAGPRDLASPGVKLFGRRGPIGHWLRNRLPATVTACSREGPLVRIDLDCGFRLSVLLTPQGFEELDLAAGHPTTAVIKAPKSHLIFR